ncbi:MAG: glutathione binding-like protein [Kofleriaceae bacterium]
MELYYSPFACSLAAHIVAREADLEVALRRVDLTTKLVEGGGDLRAVNPMGQVPTLVTDDGHALTENSAVLSYLGDRAPDRGLTPPPASVARYELQRWLSFVGTEVHKQGLAAVFGVDTPAAVKAHGRASLARPLAVLDAHLATAKTLVSTGFTVADAYLVWALVLVPVAGVSLDLYPAVQAYQARQVARPAVAAALAVERAAHKQPLAS